YTFTSNIKSPYMIFSSYTDLVYFFISAEDFRSLFGFQLVEDLENLLHSGLFKAAYTGNLNLFKGLALKHAENEGIGVTEAIKKLTLEDGRGSLHFAAAGGSLKVCKYLLEELKLDVDSKDGEGSTPLCQASVKGHFDMVRYLLEKGANPDASNELNVTPLHYAAMSGETKIITLLLSRGVRIDVVTSLGTALQFAASHGQQDAVKVLLDHGANPNAVNSQGMLRPLISAIFVKAWECMKLLLQ
ncbi:hypothetical protein MKW94_029555, partial [Papaver nudicaule]|nr:hypothetical protein [Papaver nudicaule]